MFIEVTSILKGKKLINLNTVSEIVSEDGTTKIYLIGEGDSYYTSVESYEEIKKIIMDAQSR
ncbi:hypothetical protein [Paenibacillus lactis]|uniref:hypothetical protein n=1 Tax=Paenibacillus lactis TaxID=228574 RepID=UPI003D7521BF